MEKKLTRTNALRNGFKPYSPDDPKSILFNGRFELWSEDTEESRWTLRIRNTGNIVAQNIQTVAELDGYTGINESEIRAFIRIVGYFIPLFTIYFTIRLLRTFVFWGKWGNLPNFNNWLEGNDPEYDFKRRYARDFAFIAIQFLLIGSCTTIIWSCSDLTMKQSFLPAIAFNLAWQLIVVAVKEIVKKRKTRSSEKQSG